MSRSMRRWLLALTLIITTVVASTVAVQAVEMGGILSGETKVGNIAIPGQTDSFTFYGQEGQGVVIEEGAINGSLGSAIYLYRPNGTIETSLVAGRYGTRARIENYQLKETGLYTIVITASGALDTSLTGEYGLSLILIPGATTSEQDLDGGNIPSGETAKGRISPNGDTDAFIFYGRAGQGVVIEEGAINGSLGSAIYLSRPNGTIETSLVAGRYGTRARIENYQLKETGLYTIVITASGALDTSLTGEYGLSLILIPGATTSEQDLDGGNIPSGETAKGRISPNGDTDAFIFYGRAGQGVVIEEGAINGSLGSAIYLYRPNGTIETLLVAGRYGTRARIENYQLKETGLYTIVITASGALDTSLTGEYGLSLILIPGATTSEQDLDGGNIPSGETAKGRISPNGDTDAFIFYGRAGQGVVIEEGAINGSLGSAIYLYRPNGTIETSLVAGRYGTRARIENYQLKETGLYTIVITASGALDTSLTGEYGLSFIKIPSTP